MTIPKIFLIILIMVLVSGSWGCASQRQAVRHAETPSAVRETVLFDFDRTSVRPEDRSRLEDIARWLSRDKKSIAVVEGHADQIGPSGYNEVLSEDRARAVRVFLRDQGADPRRLTVISKGERQPRVRGRGRKTLQPNRRVEVYLDLTKD